jgi:hypothetical protein
MDLILIYEIKEGMHMPNEGKVGHTQTTTELLVAAEVMEQLKHVSIIIKAYRETRVLASKSNGQNWRLTDHYDAIPRKMQRTIELKVEFKIENSLYPNFQHPSSTNRWWAPTQPILILASTKETEIAVRYNPEKYQHHHNIQTLTVPFWFWFIRQPVQVPKSNFSHNPLNQPSLANKSSIPTTTVPYWWYMINMRAAPRYPSLKNKSPYIDLIAHTSTQLQTALPSSMEEVSCHSSMHSSTLFDTVSIEDNPIVDDKDRYNELETPLNSVCQEERYIYPSEIAGLFFGLSADKLSVDKPISLYRNEDLTIENNALSLYSKHGYLSVQPN